MLMQAGEPPRFAGLDSLDPIGNGAVAHSGDEQTGAASGDDETVNVVFSDVPAAIKQGDMQALLRFTIG
ncbi:hypothetical protein ACWFPY_08375 [Nocardia fluminea]